MLKIKRCSTLTPRTHGCTPPPPPIKLVIHFLDFFIYSYVWFSNQHNAIVKIFKNKALRIINCYPPAAEFTLEEIYLFSVPSYIFICSLFRATFML